MSLARATDHAVLKQRYEALALEFAQKIGSERDRGSTVDGLPLRAPCTML